MKSKNLILAVLLSLCAVKVFPQNPLLNRRPAVAGRFYPSDPSELRTQIQQFFSKAVARIPGNPTLAIVVPHAGYVFSGEVAASGFNQIDPEQKFERIFIIGSSHTMIFKGASVYCAGNFETPLGTVPVDLDLAKKLVAENKILNDNTEPHANEHSIEVQIPFLQVYLKNNFKIVPIIIGSSDKETAQKLAAVLKPYLTEKNLFVISSDFSHYPNYQDAGMVDKITATAIQSNKASKLLSALNANENMNIAGLETSLCGWSSVLTLLYMTESMPDISVNLIQYKNSGDSSYGGKDRVVGYNAMSFSKGKAVSRPDFSLSEEDKNFLLKLARQTVEQYIRKGTTPEVDTAKLSTALKTPCGAFVTLNKNHILRGCIGQFEPSMPLWTVVELMAVASATQDYRFSRVEPKELNQIKIEISVLSPLKRIKSADEFIPGKQGIYMKKGDSHGTFLPQVAESTGWTKEELLGHCAEEKAGIGWDGWKTAELYTFEALVFGE